MCATGREERIGDRFGLGRECERLGQLGFELHGRHPIAGVPGSLAVMLHSLPHAVVRTVGRRALGPAQAAFQRSR